MESSLEQTEALFLHLLDLVEIAEVREYARKHAGSLARLALHEQTAATNAVNAAETAESELSNLVDIVANAGKLQSLIDVYAILNIDMPKFPGFANHADTLMKTNEK